nr:MAG TPA: hypothetical protein [Caudoviricetes sp.]
MFFCVSIIVLYLHQYLQESRPKGMRLPFR